MAAEDRPQRCHRGADLAVLGDSGILTDGAPAIVGPAGSQIVAYRGPGRHVPCAFVATGVQLYSYQTGSYIAGSVAETDGNLLVASADGFLYDFAPGGGNPPAPTTSVTSPAPSSTIPNPGGPLTISGTAPRPRPSEPLT